MTGGGRAAERQAMVTRQLRSHGIEDPAVLEAFLQVPRHEFVPPESRSNAYDDGPLGIGCRQTISQPRMVATMTVALGVQPGMEVLEIGVGSGYQTAILLELGATVVGVERHPPLAREASQRLRALGYADFDIHVADGSLGWPSGAPYERILVAAAAPAAPPSLLDQLTVDGRLLLPVGDRRVQELALFRKTAPGNVRREDLGGVVFVPLVGQEGFPLP